jgi:hypothetical protein
MDLNRFMRIRTVLARGGTAADAAFGGIFAVVLELTLESFQPAASFGLRIIDGPSVARCNPGGAARAGLRGRAWRRARPGQFAGRFHRDASFSGQISAGTARMMKLGVPVFSVPDRPGSLHGLESRAAAYESKAGPALAGQSCRVLSPSSSPNPARAPRCSPSDGSSRRSTGLAFAGR